MNVSTSALLMDEFNPSQNQTPCDKLIVETCPSCAAILTVAERVSSRCVVCGDDWSDAHIWHHSEQRHWDLYVAAKRVVERWEGGNLAQAVRDLDSLLTEIEEV